MKTDTSQSPAPRPPLLLLSELKFLQENIIVNNRTKMKWCVCVCVCVCVYVHEYVYACTCVLLIQEQKHW